MYTFIEMHPFHQCILDLSKYINIRFYQSPLILTELFQHNLINVSYFILSSEINAYQKQIKVISITSKMISLYFHCSVFLITSDFSIHLMQLTSKAQTPITFLFANKNIKGEESSS